MSKEEDGGFVIFSGAKLWYASKEGIENSLYKPKAPRMVNKVRNSAKNKRVIEHQLFENIKNIEKDEYWISFFEDAAVGKMPRNFKFIGDVVSYRIKNKTMELKIPMDSDTEEISIMIKNFLFENAGIISPTDLQDRKNNEERRLAASNNSDATNWNQIRSEKQQTFLISVFVQNIGEYYNLSLEEKKTLIQQIKIAILAGFFNSNNIEIVGNEIVQISGLEFDEENRQFIVNTDSCKMIKSTKKNISEITFDMTTDFDEVEIPLNSKKSLIKQWHRYLSDINKKYR
jgi:hypothetical protein